MQIATMLQEQHQGYAEALATEIWRRLPSHVDRSELIGFAMVGLAEAASQFDPGRGVSFETFAYYRIRGAVFDGLRKMTWLPPRARRDLAAEAGSDLIAQDEPVTESGNIDEICRRFARATRSVGAVFLASQLSSRHDDRTSEPMADDEDSATLERHELVRRVSAALADLPAVDRALIEKLYMDQKSMTDCASELGVHKSTISRQHAKAIAALRDRLTDQ